MLIFNKLRAPTTYAALAIMSLSGLGLAGCNNKDPLAESQANMIENSADSVRASGETAANAIESSGAATETSTNALADSVRDARNAQANEIDATADAVRDTATTK